MKSIPFEDLYLDVYYPEVVDAHEPLNLLYVLDGDAFSLMIAENIKLQMRNAPKTGVAPTIVVGISYHDTSIFSRERRFLDFTPPKINPRSENDVRKDFPSGGEISTFLAKLNRAHKIILADYQINQEKVGFFGHSLGGLCVLESYLKEATPFITDYIAVSPSLWWDQEEFFNKLTNNASFEKGNIAISVGELEGDMVDFAYKAKDMLTQLEAVNRFSFYVAPEENHMSVVFQTMSRNLRWFCQ